MFFSNCSLVTVLSCGLSTNRHNGFPLPFFLCLRSSFRKSQPGSLAQTVIENIAYDTCICRSPKTPGLLHPPQKLCRSYLLDGYQVLSFMLDLSGFELLCSTLIDEFIPKAVSEPAAANDGIGCTTTFDPVGERIREQEQQNVRHEYHQAECPSSRPADESR
jgi:hypothetical protein